MSQEISNFYAIIIFLNKFSSTVHDLKLSHFFQKKKIQKSVTILEHLPKRYHFWTIIKQEQKKGKTCDNFKKKCDNLRSDCITWES